MTVASGMKLTRRAALRTWAAMAAVVAAGGVSLRGALGARQATIYYLDPNCAGTPDACDHPTDKRNKHSCNVCYACINHAKHKRWASEEAITRAHPCCRCSVKKSKVPAAVFETMFGTGASFAPEYDARHA
jgi:hypothetical protein